MALRGAATNLDSDVVVYASGKPILSGGALVGSIVSTVVLWWTRGHERGVGQGRADPAAPA